ncbi:unnamed protein product [Heterobilharzia americana]|nr:unnamed protein product [Heterobilharzia americana]
MQSFTLLHSKNDQRTSEEAAQDILEEKISRDHHFGKTYSFSFGSALSLSRMIWNVLGKLVDYLTSDSVTLMPNSRNQKSPFKDISWKSCVSLESIDDKDPLFRAAHDGTRAVQKLCTADDVEGGIGVTKLERLKRVEENEEQRERLKTVNNDWTNNIRFLLNKVQGLGKLPVIHSKQKNTAHVARLLEVLTTDKKIVPIGFVPRIHNPEEQLSKLQDMVDTRRTTIRTEERSMKGKISVRMLRILLTLPKEKLYAITYISAQLWTAKFQRLKDVVRYLFLTQLAIEYCQNEFNRQQSDEISTSVTKYSVFCAEIIHSLAQMFRLTVADTNSQNILVLKKSPPSIESPDSINLSIQLLDSSTRLSRDEMPTVRLACVYRMIRLSSQIFDVYDKVLPKCVLVNLFRPLKTALIESDFLFYPAVIINEVRRLSEAITIAEKAPAPPRLVVDSRLSILNTLKPTDSKTLKRLGILPQLEPVFDERIFASRRSKIDTKRILQRRVAKEKRCAMRAVRQDSQFLASHQLKLTKRSDSVREKKTKAILNSLRSVED